MTIDYLGMSSMARSMHDEDVQAARDAWAAAETVYEPAVWDGYDADRAAAMLDPWYAWVDLGDGQTIAYGRSRAQALERLAFLRAQGPRCVWDGARAIARTWDGALVCAGHADLRVDTYLP